MRLLIKRLLFISTLLPSVTFAANNTDKALLDININGENLGVQAVQIRDGDVIIPVDTFKNWRIKKELWAKQTEEVSLRSLVPYLQYNLDNTNASLTVTAAMDSFETQVIETRSQYNPVIPADVVHPADWSGFLNYALGANFSQVNGFDSLNAPWEIGLTHGQWFAFSSFNSNYSSLDNSSRTTRGNTYLQWEDTQTRQRVTLGDFSLNLPTLSSGGNFGGLLWQSNFRQYAQFQYMPSFDMNFNVQTPSHAELYVNNVKTKEWDLQPGNVSLPALLSSGQGNANLVLTDAFGRQQQISQPFYITQQLLKEGLHDFSYGAGAMRNYSSPKMMDYGNLVFLGSHRYGFSNNLTAGAAVTASNKISNFGLSLTNSFLGHNLIDTAVTMSHQSAANGYLATGRYQFNYGGLNLTVNGRYMSRKYGNLYVDANSLQKQKSDLQAFANYNIPLLGGSLGAGFSESTSWNDNKTSRALNLFYRQSLYKTLSLNMQVRHDLSSGDNVASLMLNYFPEIQDESNFLHNNNLSYQLDYDDKTHSDRQIWQSQKQGNIGEGYNYTAALQKQDTNLSGFLRYQYKNNNGIYTANYAQNEQSSSGNIGIAGSLVSANNEVFLARPITDSFAVVKVNGSEEDVPVYSNGGRFGVANENKAIVIPNLQSRQLGKISIKTEDISLAATSEHTEKTVEIGVRTANLVEFNVSKFVAAEGNAYILAADGSKQYLEALPLEYTVKGKVQESFIAKKGFFYLENVPTGEFNATVKRYKHDCTLHLTIPKSETVVAKLGDVLCVGNTNENNAVEPNTGISEPIKTANETQPITLKPYSIQIMASERKADVSRFVEKHQGIAQLRIITKSKGGVSLFAAIYGEYETYAEAKKELSKLPYEFKKESPWIIKINN